LASLSIFKEWGNIGIFGGVVVRLVRENPPHLNPLPKERKKRKTHPQRFVVRQVRLMREILEA